MIMNMIPNYLNLPSQSKSNYWIQKESTWFYSTEVSGKWCIFCTSDEVDNYWKIICSLLDEQKLICAKVSTRLMKEKTNRSGHAICVYTTNYTDIDDVMKYRLVLLNAGFTQELFYKRDIDTMNPNPNQPEFYYTS